MKDKTNDRQRERSKKECRGTRTKVPSKFKTLNLISQMRYLSTQTTHFQFDNVLYQAVIIWYLHPLLTPPSMPHVLFRHLPHSPRLGVPNHKVTITNLFVMRLKGQTKRGRQPDLCTGPWQQTLHKNQPDDRKPLPLQPLQPLLQFHATTTYSCRKVRLGRRVG